MRQQFKIDLLEELRKRESLVVVTGDLGFGVFDDIRNEFPERFHNVGAAEQFMLGFSSGLSMGGMFPIVYSITPFLLSRPYESLRNYVNHEKLPMLLVGSGRDMDYYHDGFSHYAGDDEAILSAFPNIEVYKPDDTAEIAGILHEVFEKQIPAYLNLKR